MKTKIVALFEAKLKTTPKITSITRLGGLTNFNYKVETTEGDYVVRYPGIGTEDLINRGDEFKFTKLSNDLGIDAHNYYFDPATGVKISQYIPHAITFNPELAKERENLKLIAGTFQELHHSGQKVESIFNVFDKIKEYEDLINQTDRRGFWADYARVREQIYALKEEYESFKVELSFCHNDPLCENFVLGKDRLYLVDWEYGGMNDPLWDVADVMIEANLNEEEEEAFKTFYFDREASQDEDRRLVMNKVFLDFLWSLWGLQRFSVGEDDMQAYADERYDRMKENLNILLSQKKES